MDLSLEKHTSPSGCALGIGCFSAISPWWPWYNYYIVYGPLMLILMIRGLGMDKIGLHVVIMFSVYQSALVPACS